MPKDPTICTRGVTSVEKVIANQFVGISFDDLTLMQRNIASALLVATILYKDESGILQLPYFPEGNFVETCEAVAADFAPELPLRIDGDRDNETMVIRDATGMAICKMQHWRTGWSRGYAELLVAGANRP